ncbi:MAG: hypothetical protein WCZ18_04350, partial [Ottowia sp.]
MNRFPRQIARLAREFGPTGQTIHMVKATFFYPGVLRSLSDFGPIYCAGGTSGPFLPAFSLHSWAMRLKIKQNCPR